MTTMTDLGALLTGAGTDALLAELVSLVTEAGDQPGMTGTAGILGRLTAVIRDGAVSDHVRRSASRARRDLLCALVSDIEGAAYDAATRAIADAEPF